jgi:branched-chain amino acid transport system ATP-binding protein
MSLLSVSDIYVSYGAVPAASGVSLTIDPGEVRIILGANGAGKTTILRTILGLTKPKQGSIQFDGAHELLSMRTHQIHGLGIAWVPEGRQLWGTMTVLENIRLGATLVRDDKTVTRRIDAMMDRFPRLRERRRQLAGSLSGGEQQMVALARALVSGPRLLLMDEPSLGLAPLVVQDVFALAREINETGISILLVEQNARQALRIAHWVYLLETGRIVDQGSPDAMMSNPKVQEIFLGGSAT